MDRNRQKIGFVIPSLCWEVGNGVCHATKINFRRWRASAIWILWFHRLRALQVGSAPFTDISHLQTDPLWALSAIHCLDTRLVFGCRTHHWTRRVLHWQPLGQRRLGRPKQCWEKKLEMICCYQGLVHREGAAQDHKFWIHQFNYFLRFCCQWACTVPIKV